jgi:hypothetical protein
MSDSSRRQQKYSLLILLRRGLDLNLSIIDFHLVRFPLPHLLQFRHGGWCLPKVTQAIVVRSSSNFKITTTPFAGECDSPERDNLSTRDSFELLQVFLQQNE